MNRRRVDSLCVTIALLGCLLLGTSACGFFFVHGPPRNYQSMTSVSCTTGIAGPVLDIAGFAWFTLNMDVNAQHGAVLATAIDGALTVALTVAALDGAGKIRACRAAQAELAARLAPPKPALIAPPKPAAVTPPTAAAPIVATVTVTPALDSLRVGQTVQLVAVVRLPGRTSVPDSAVSWRSSARQVASVGKTGLVTARTPGVAVITAKAADVEGSAKVVVLRR